MPRPLVNHPVFDLDGRFLGTPDLLDPEAGLATEFDGRDHRGRRQHQSDNIREEKLEGVNLTVCRVDSLDMRQPVPLRERLRARHAQGMRRNREPGRVDTCRTALVAAPPKKRGELIKIGTHPEVIEVGQRPLAKRGAPQRSQGLPLT